MSPYTREWDDARRRSSSFAKLALQEHLKAMKAKSADSIGSNERNEKQAVVSSDRLSKSGIELVKRLVKTQIYKDWTQTFGVHDPRSPVVEMFQNVAKEQETTHISPTLRRKFIKWASSFRRSDPRFQILQFFNTLAHMGTDNMCRALCGGSGLTPTSHCPFDRASIFSVWRPTCVEAIRKMMLGQAVGKGLEIKGKSAKKGKLSGFVPFLQIHEEKHKRMIRSLSKESKTRVFFATREARDEAAMTLQTILKEMQYAVQWAKETIASGCCDSESHENALQHMRWDMVDPGIDIIDNYAPECFGMDVPERLLWEGYIMRQDCDREPDSDYDVGRMSEPAFQDMNFAALRNATGSARRVVLWQHASPEHPMCPQNLLMAYEEGGRVMPVVSDFDCFLVGTRRVSFGCDIPSEQVEMMRWSVSQIEKILNSPQTSDTWTMRWLEVLKKEAEKGFHPDIPPYGFGDPSSYSIMGNAVKSLQKDGCVRHGAECFNYYFPQELDDEFLVISSTSEIGENQRWQYVNTHELQDILCQKIDMGFTFPLNLKWVLCDPGWKRVYDRLMASQKLYVQKSLDVWFPLESGVREKVEAIYAKHPMGFQRRIGRRSNKQRKNKYSPLRRSFQDGVFLSGTAAMDLAQLELKHHVSLKRAKKKLRAALSFNELAGRVKQRSVVAPKMVERAASSPHPLRPPCRRLCSKRLRDGLEHSV